MKRKIMLLLACLFVGIGLATAQTQTVTGVVISEEDGQPVIGASVLVKDTQLGTITGIDGDFKLTNVPSSAKTIVVSYIGMQTQEVAIKENLRIALKADNEMLEEIVITGYGTGKKIGSVVGSVGKVNSEKLAKVATANFTDALAGQVSGLSVLSSSGDPSKSASIRLRGVSSINASTTPLFILDGAPISSSMFNTLNPGDIENITVLKDASSTAIYGSRAANGVIVITSKKGKMGQKANVTLRAQYGFSKMVEDQAEMMNSEQYIQFRDLIGQPVPQNIKDLVDKYGISTNWRDKIFSGNAPTYTVDASVSGGGDKISYYMSLNHHDQQGIIAQSGMRRESLRFNIDARVNDWLKVGLQSNLGFTKFEQNNEVEADGLYTSSPTLFSRLALPYDTYRYYTINEQGGIEYGDVAQKLKYSGLTTPKFVCDTRDVKRRRITGNVVLFQELNPIKGLTLRSQQSLDAYDYTVSNIGYPYETIVTPMGSTISERSGYRQESFSRYYSFTYTNTAEYKFNIGDNNFNVLAGQEAILSKSNSFGVFTEGHTDPRQMRLTDASTVSIADLTHSQAESVFNSYFFTASYNWDEKYYLDATFRRDGSSYFSPDHRWANFYSVGAMWDIKKEKFMDNIEWVNELSLKASYGQTGNSELGSAYGYFGLIGTGSPYNASSSLGIAQASNYDLTWETVTASNIGVHFRLFDRFSVDAEYYQKKTTDMLMQIPYSYTTGFSTGNGNIGAMTNNGVDLEIKADIIDTNDFYWGVRANFNYNKNEITELFNGRDEYVVGSTGLKYTVGHSVGEFYYVRHAGVDPRDGKQMWYDKDGNLTKVFNEERDAVLLGKDMYAPFNGGFGTDFKWKGLSVSADFTWQADKWLLNNDNYFLENASQGVAYNQTTKMLNIWTKPGQITDVPAFGEQIQFDDHLLEDASFLRLKKIQVQYEFPQRWAKAAGMQRASVFFIGRNLLTFTKYSGYDPEPDVNLVAFNYPNTRQFVFGVEVTF